TKSLERDVPSSKIFGIQDEVVQSVISVVGGYYGVIFQEMAKASPVKVSKNRAVHKGIYCYYKYQQSFSLQDYNVAVVALQSAIHENGSHAASWAMLGELYLQAIGLKITTIDN